MDRVGVEFTGSNVGAVAAARGTAQAIGQVRTSARESGPSLKGLETDLGRIERGALAGTGALHGMGRAALYLGGTYLGAFGLGAAFRSATEELGAQIKVTAQVAAALRSTGGVAGETARSIDELAKAEMRKTGIDDEVVKGAEAMLLRFTQVRDVAGQGNDIFGRATKTALDLSVALGRDATDAAFALGKALNDPTRGVQQLRRVGAAFTVEEAKQIKQLAEHGHVLQAQKAILDALTRSYGGTADAVGKVEPWMRLRETLKNLSADAIKPLLPDFQKVADRVDAWANALENNSTAQQRLKTDVENGLAVAKDFADGANAVAGAIGGWRSALELVLALKVAGIVSDWTLALKAFVGTEAAATGVAGANAATATLEGRLKRLRILTSKPFQFIIAYEIIKKITGANADLSNDAGGAGDLLPVYENGKWVDPLTGTPVADQAYWNKRYRKDGGKGKPAQGTTAAGDVAGSKQGSLIATARTALGNPYQYGGAPSLSKPTDCSGLMVAVFAKNGISLPRTSQEQYARAPMKNARPLLPGDLVFAEGVHPGHVGLYIGNDQVLEDPHTGDHVKIVALKDFGWNGESARWWGGKENTRQGGGDTGAKHGNADPPTSHTGSTASTNALPVSVRQAVSAAGVAAAAAALTPGKADDKAAVAQQRAALEDEINWIRAKLATNIGKEKRITLEDLLTGALGDLKTLQPGKKAGGASIGVVTSLRNTVANDLKGLPSTLDDVEQNAVDHLKKLRDSLKVGMSSKDLATTRVGIQNWGKTLKAEITKQAKIAADAANEAARLWQRGWQNDVNRALRDFQENVVDKQLDSFDRETQAGLKAIQARYSTQTPEERALAGFDATQAAAAAAKQRADIASQIADINDQIAALNDASGTLIDIATGQRTAFNISDTTRQRKDLLAQLQNLNEQSAQLDLADQRAALQASADLSRTAADQKASDEQDAYQDARSAQRQALQDRLDDQATALTQDLEDWGLWLENKKKAYSDFLQWLRDHGLSTAGIGDPAFPGSGGNSGGTASGDRIPFVRTGAIPFASGGKVPGRYVGRNDMVLSRLTPGETVIDRKLTAALEDMLVSGGGSGPTVAIFNLDGRPFAQAVAQPMSAEQARQIGYTIQRG